MTASRHVPRPLRLLRLVVLIAAASLAVWAGDQAAQAISEGAPAGTVHVVASGETVWEIVVAEYGARERDVRVVVDEVMAVNDLGSAELQPGQELFLPRLAD